jgi:hypothetical protein
MWKSPALAGTAWYIRYRKHGRLVEEKAGWRCRDNMTAAKAASIRGTRMEGKELSDEEKRSAARAAKAAEEARYSINRLWSHFEEVKAGNRTIKE